MKPSLNRKNLFGVSVFLTVVGILVGAAKCETYGGGNGTAEDLYLIYDANQMNTIGVSQAGAFSGSGSGTMEDPYVITTVEQLQEMANELDAHYVLANDIDASDTIHWNGGQGFKPIGDSIVPSDTGGDDHLFTGSFDGRHCRITGLFINRPSMDFAGLFGIVEYAEIKNVILVDIYIRGKQWVGGLVGDMAYSTVSNCSASGSINGPYIAGGLVGRSFVGSISSSASTGSVNCQGSGRFFGGLCGVNSGHSRYGKAYVTNCYSTSNVSSRHIQVGGLIGSNVTAVVTNCYSTGLVTCLDSDCSEIGGLIGEHRNSSCSSTYWNIETSEQAQSAAGQGKTTAEMMRLETFLGWDFATPIWTICEGVDYPRLWWENTVPAACIVGGDQIVEADSNCEARVVLDGSCSSDEDSTQGTNDDINDFDWYEISDPCNPDSDILLGTGEIIECNLPSGVHNIMLVVMDKAGASDSNEITITVEDNIPPQFTLTVKPNVLWPPNNKMIEIMPVLDVSDNCDDDVDVSLVGITMNETANAGGSGHTAGDILIDPNDGSIRLRAERNGKGAGRIYTITYQAVDDSNNIATASAMVTVPHDRR